MYPSTWMILIYKYANRKWWYLCHFTPNYAFHNNLCSFLVPQDAGVLRGRLRKYGREADTWTIKPRKSGNHTCAWKLSSLIRLSFMFQYLTNTMIFLNL